MPNGFTFLGLDIKYYGLIIATAFLLGLILVSYLAKKKGYHKDLPFDLLIIIFPLAIIGARLYYIIFSSRSWTLSQMLAIQDGGLAIYGGVIGGFIGLLIYAIVKNIKVIKLTDLAVPALILGQALGRWGNFLTKKLMVTKLQTQAYNGFLTLYLLKWRMHGIWLPSFMRVCGT
jgi:phosphatidylglycerol:prolipoprotein diacylglycerol transferase